MPAAPVAALLLSALLPARAEAAPLTVRVPVTIELQADPSPDKLTVGGRLSDDQGVGVAGRELTLVVLRGGRAGRGGPEVARGRVITDGLGAFERHFPLGLGAYRVEAVFHGEALVASATAAVRADVQRLPLQVILVVPPRVRVGADATARVTVLSESGPVPRLPMTVRIDGARRRGVAARAGTDGRLELRLPTRPPGRHTIQVSSRGDRLHKPASASAGYQVVVQATLFVRAALERRALDDAMQLSGRLTAAGRPLVGRTISLVADGEAAGELRTEDGGLFSARVPRRRFAEGGGALELRFEGDETSDATVAVARVAFPPARPVPRWLYLGPALVCLLLLLLGWVVENRRAWAAARAAARDRRAQRRAARRWARPLTPLGDGDAHVGLPAPPPADRDGVAGVLVDRTTGVPLREARIALTPGGPATECDTLGRFSLAGVPPGRYALEATSPGHMPVSVPVRLPHRGDLERVRLSLVPIREAVRDAWQGAVAPWEGPVPWGRRTPREVRTDRLEAGEPLTDLTRLVEEAWFSGRQPAEADAETARRLASLLRPGR